MTAVMVVDAQCTNSSRLLPDTTLNFIKTHPLMNNAVPATGGAPLLLHTSFKSVLTLCLYFSVSVPFSPSLSLSLPLSVPLSVSISFFPPPPPPLHPHLSLLVYCAVIIYLFSKNIFVFVFLACLFVYIIFSFLFACFIPAENLHYTSFHEQTDKIPRHRKH